jgi:membrane protein
MNIIFNVPPVTKGGFKRSMKNRGAALLMVIAVGILFLVFLAIEAFVSILINTIPAGSQNRLIATIVNYVVQFLLLTVLIALIFKSVPDKQITWGDVWPGAALTAILFIIGRFLIGLYLSFNKTASGYGTAGSLVILLIWIFYSAQIFFFGTEFTQVYARTVGSHKGLPDDAKLKGEDEEEGAHELPEEHEPLLEKASPDIPPTDNPPKDSNPPIT